MKKRLLAALLAAAMTFSLAACASTSDSESSKDESSSSENSNDDTTVDIGNGFVIGSVTDLNGDFMTGWSNGSQNKAIKNLISGYGTYEMTESQTYELNDVSVASVSTELDDEGNKTYIFEIAQNLVWNNGEAITASDYVFSILLYASNEFGELDGADNSGSMEIVGWADYNSGDSDSFAGVHLIDDYTFSMTISAVELPNFYEAVLVAVSPLPMAVIAPDATIVESEDGAAMSEEFTVDVLRETILDSSTGYRYNPQVTCGPYNFVSFDEGSLQAVLELNDTFLGRSDDGATGSIEKLVFKSVTAATEMDELRAGTVDLLPGISGGESITTGLDIVDEGLASYTSYPRAGYGKLEFACDYGPTQFTAVRQAIAYCLDRTEFANQYTGGYGSITHAWYGLSQWEYEVNADALETELNTYAIDLTKAEEVLIADGWVLNANGEEFVKGTDDVRYKMVDGELMPLIIKWASTSDNPVSTLLSTMLPDNAASIGMKIEQTVMDFTTLLDYIYRTEPDTSVYHMFNLATGFGDILPTWYYSSPDMFGLYNTERIDDETLYSIALDMKNTDPSDTEAWAAKWLEYQKRYNELVVNLPLYSDEYHEFFTTELTNYQPIGLWSWEHAILRATLEA